MKGVNLEPIGGRRVRKHIMKMIWIIAVSVGTTVGETGNNGTVDGGDDDFMTGTNATWELPNILFMSLMIGLAMYCMLSRCRSNEMSMFPIADEGQKSRTITKS